MKKFFITILVVLALLLLAMQGNIYQIQGIVTNKDEITDRAGHIWEYETDDFHAGDTVTITFYDRGTTNRTDDVIKGIK